MIHNPFNNPKFAVSMVVFFLLIATLFYDTSYQIANRITGNLATPSASRTTEKTVDSKYCKDFAKSFTSSFRQTSRRTQGITLAQRKDLARCAEKGLLRGAVTIPAGKGGEEGTVAGANSCPADINGDLTVNDLDMDIVIANWGASGGPADVNGNGTVNVDDLLAVVSAWGACGGSQVPTAGLIGNYSLNSNVNDSSSYANNGTGNGLTYVTGHTGNAAQFSGNNSYASVSSLSNDLNTSAGSIAFWAKRDFANNTTVWPTHIGLGKDATNLVEVYYDPQVDMFVFHHIGNGTEVRTQASPTDFPQGEWHHIAMTWDVSANQMKVFIDGSQFGNTKTGVQSWNGVATNSFIGKSMTGPDYWNGALDEVLIYNRALSNSEVQTIYTGGTTPPPPPGAVCGNGVIEGTEQCDGSNLGGMSCTSPSVGTFSGGTLSCNATTCTFNTSQCTVPPAGSPEIVVEWQNGTTWTNINDGATSAINFGSVTQNSTAPTRTFRIRNTGTSNLTFGSVTVPTGYTVTSQPTSPVVANGTANFVVRMNTGTQGTFPGQITFTNNDSNENPFNFAITGAVTGGQQGAGAEISVSSNESGSYVNIPDGQTNPDINFGTYVQGQTGPTIRFRVRNEAPAGSAALTINYPTIPPGFVITTPPDTYSIAAGSYTDFIVRMLTETVGTKSGQISFTNNDSNETPFNFDITGTVTAGGSSGPCVNLGGAGNPSYSNCTTSSPNSAFTIPNDTSLSSITFTNANVYSGTSAAPAADSGYALYCGGCQNATFINSHFEANNGDNDYTIRGVFNNWTSSNSQFINDGDNKAVFRVYSLTNGSSNGDTFAGDRMMLGGGYAAEGTAPFGAFQNFLFQNDNIDVSSIEIYPNSYNIRFKNVDFSGTGHITFWDGSHHVSFECSTNIPTLKIGGQNYNPLNGGWPASRFITVSCP